jgi:pyridoxal phosphate enzyme (YggS family)
MEKTPDSKASSKAPSGIAGNLAGLRSRIALAAQAAARDPANITLVAVSKTHDASCVEAALALGQRVFGENRVQEAAAKFPALKSRYPDLILHLVGPLQTNKADEAVALFDWIETLDRPRLAEALAKAMEKTGRRPSCLVQVNTGREAQKAGVAPEAADAFIEDCRARWKLPVQGLMCIPPANENPAPHFSLLAGIARRNGLAELSMGMSADFETAIREGASFVRIGTAIFGPRPKPTFSGR